MKINANDQLDIKGICLAGCYGDGQSFSYNILMRNSSTNLWMPLIAKKNYTYSTGLMSSDLTLTESIFADFPENIIWKIELSIYIASRNASGVTSVLFYVNRPPKNGSCILSPTNGFTSTIFKITCLEWIDFDGSLASFAFYGKISL